MREITINSIDEYIKQINKDISNWKAIKSYPWFRGQPVDMSLLPKLFRKRYDSLKENDLIQDFRMRAQALYKTPEYHRIDEWLFLMQHSGLPTRLLDWTDGALIGLFFAVGYLENIKNKDLQPVVWMLNPLAFNCFFSHYYLLPLSWGEYHHQIVGSEEVEKTNVPIQIGAAFTNSKLDTDLPLALKPQHVHPRVSAQRSCFTIHGRIKKGIDEFSDDLLIDDRLKDIFPDIDILFEKNREKGKHFNDIYLIKYVINPKMVKKMLHELRILGISYATLFPDLDGLSKELSFD